MPDKKNLCMFCMQKVKGDFVELFRNCPGVDAGLAASIFHFGEVRIPDLKEQLKAAGIPMRPVPNRKQETAE